MPSHPAKATPSIILRNLIAPKEVWVHLSEREQQADCQVLTYMLQAYLQTVTTDNKQEPIKDGFDSEQPQNYIKASGT